MNGISVIVVMFHINKLTFISWDPFLNEIAKKSGIKYSARKELNFE